MGENTEHAAFRANVEAAIERDDPQELQDLILEVGLESNEREWAQSCCVQLARHRSSNVRGSAVLALASLARRFGRLDPNRVKRQVQLALWDRSDYVRRQALSAAEDLETFLSWEFERPDDA